MFPSSQCFRHIIYMPSSDKVLHCYVLKSYVNFLNVPTVLGHHKNNVCCYCKFRGTDLYTSLKCSTVIKKVFFSSKHFEAFYIITYMVFGFFWQHSSAVYNDYCSNSHTNIPICLHLPLTVFCFSYICSFSILRYI